MVHPSCRNAASSHAAAAFCTNNEAALKHMRYNRDALWPIENLSRDTSGWRGHDVTQHFACSIQAALWGFLAWTQPSPDLSGSTKRRTP
jgi:hypothetical protein